MTQKQNDDIKRLFNLAELTEEFEFIDIRLVDKWCELREELGLAKLLLMIRDYVKHKINLETAPPKTSDSNQNPDVVQ